MQFEIVDLRRCPEHVSELALWHHEEWLRGREQQEDQGAELNGFVVGQDIREREHSLRSHLGDGQVPTSFIARCQAGAIGSVSIVSYQFSREQYPKQWLTNLYVLEAYRRQGVGEALLLQAVAFAKDIGLKEMYLYTRDQSLYYQKRGWQFSHQGLVQGQAVDVLSISFPKARV